MHILTVMEVARGDMRSTSTADIDQTSAATWSFAGVLLTLIAGIGAKGIASTTAEAWALAVPLFFIGRWAFFHWRISKLLDGSIVEAELHALYRNAILKVFDESHVEGLSLEQIAPLVNQKLPASRVLYYRSRLFRCLVPVSVEHLVDRFLPTSDNLKPILTELVESENLRTDGSKYYKRSVPPSAGAP